MMNLSIRQPGFIEKIRTMKHTFSDDEQGIKIKTGEIFNELPEEHPLYRNYFHFSKKASEHEKMADELFEFIVKNGVLRSASVENEPHETSIN